MTTGDCDHDSTPYWSPSDMYFVIHHEKNVFFFPSLWPRLQPHSRSIDIYAIFMLSIQLYISFAMILNSDMLGINERSFNVYVCSSLCSTLHQQFICGICRWLFLCTVFIVIPIRWCIYYLLASLLAKTSFNANIRPQLELHEIVDLGMCWMYETDGRPIWVILSTDLAFLVLFPPMICCLLL